jgi:aspartyl aminopeptidase
LKFVNYAVSPYHAVDWAKKHLLSKGFKEIQEVDNWNLAAGNKYFFTRNYSTLVAFTVGSKFDPDNTAYNLVGAHTDSPCLKINPVSKATKNGIEQCCISTYGGGLWHTWFDRDLILAGRVVYEHEGKYTSALWRSDRALMKIPNLAIHLSDDRAKFEPSKENHLKPFYDSVVFKKLLNEKLEEEGQIFSKHNAGLIKLVSEQLKISPKSIVDFDFYFADANPSSYVGINEDFISSPRLDNLFSTWHCTYGCIQLWRLWLRSRTKETSSTWLSCSTTKNADQTQLKAQDHQSSTNPCTESSRF